MDRCISLDPCEKGGRDKMKKVLLIYNPKAGVGLIRNQLDFVVAKFQEAGYMVIPVRGARPSDIDPYMSQAKELGVDRVIAAGGDGTINQVVNAMARYEVDLPLAIFPVGTANDFAYYFSIPGEIEQMVDIALGDRLQNVDVGCVNGQYFINVSAMGCLVDLSQRTDPTLKNTLGVLAYYLQGVKELPNLRPLTMRFESEEFTGEEKVYFALVMNGKSAGSFKHLASPAAVDDGKMDVLLFKETHVLDFPQLALDFVMGQHRDNKNVIYFQTSHIVIDTDEEVGVDVDGETGGTFPLDIRVYPDHLKVFVPEQKKHLSEEGKGKRYDALERILYGRPLI